MLRNIILIIILGLTIFSPLTTHSKDFEIRRRSTFYKPPFSLKLPTEFYLAHSFLRDFPSKNSRTRAYIFIKEKNNEVEELLIIQIADRTNPRAGPITAPPLKPYTEKRKYIIEKLMKNGIEIDYIIQLMAWNPDAPSLRPIIDKGIKIPHQWALQGQLLFIYQGEHTVSLRYSKSINSYEMKFSMEARDWEKERIKGNEKKIYEIFKKLFLEMINSIEIRSS